MILYFSKKKKKKKKKWQKIGPDGPDKQKPDGPKLIGLKKKSSHFKQQQQQATRSISAINKNRVISPVGIEIHRPFFKFDSIKEILEA
jgi:hypothetical protein